MKPLSSKQHDVDDLDAAIDLYYTKGWTDGLPIVPPTEEKVARLISAAGREPDEVIANYYERRRIVTVEKLAINAVMAGCLPDYFPVVLAIVEAMSGPRIGLHGGNASTGGMAVGFIVNGPVRDRLGMNYRGNVLGPGNRANSTIGRAVRLAQINVMGSVGGAGNPVSAGRDILDRSTMGQPGKYAGYHVVENEEDFPTMRPLHVELGFEPGESVVTVFPTSGHIQISTHENHGAEAIVDTIAHYLVAGGKLAKSFVVILLPPECVEHFVRDGWSKSDIRQAIFERGARTVAWAKRNGWMSGPSPIDPRGGDVLPGDEEKQINVAASTDDILLVVTGGPAGAFVHGIFSYGGSFDSKVIRSAAW